MRAEVYMCSSRIEDPNGYDLLLLQIYCTVCGNGKLFELCSFLQSESFGLYALYSKNKPQSDALILHRRHDIFKVHYCVLSFCHLKL